MSFASMRLSAGSFATAAAALILFPVLAQAQPMLDPAPLDPTSTLDPLPDLGVDWPDLSAPEEAPPAGTERPVATVDTAVDRPYRVAIEGLDEVGDEALRRRFDELSALDQDKDKVANVAQIDRRVRQDESLLRELLRAYG